MLAVMRALASIALLLTLVTTAGAEPAPAAQAKPTSTSGSAAPDVAGSRPSQERRALVRELRAEREKRVRERGEIFARIAVKHDYRGEYVVFRDKNVTAFLDLKDPAHPRYKPEHDEESPDAAGKRRAHILVVPNEPRETIGKTLSSDITADDLDVTLSVMREATAVAARLGIEKPRIYVRSPERVGVGYLHVHIVGERDPKVPYPAPLK